MRDALYDEMENAIPATRRRCGGGRILRVPRTNRISAQDRGFPPKIAEVLLVHQAKGRRHAGALVEAERAGVVRRVDAKPYAALTALPEASERVAEERRALRLA